MWYWRVKRKGFFLVFSLWITMLLTIFCLGLGFRTYIETRKTKLFISRMRSYQTAFGGIKAACALLAEDDRASDNLTENWAEPFTQEIVFSHPKERGSFKVAISDESARADLNKAPLDMLDKIFRQKDIGNRESVLKALFYYSGRLPKAPGESFGKTAKGQAFTSLPELSLVDGFSPDMYKTLSDFLTVHGDNRVNINTVSEELLRVIIDDPGLCREVLERRFSSGPGFFEQPGQIPLLVAGLFKTVSDVYRIVSVGQAGPSRCEIVCVYNRKTKNFLYWYEN